MERFRRCNEDLIRKYCEAKAKEMVQITLNCQDEECTTALDDWEDMVGPRPKPHDAGPPIGTNPDRERINDLLYPKEWDIGIYQLYCLRMKRLLDRSSFRLEEWVTTAAAMEWVKRRVLKQGRYLTTKHGSASTNAEDDVILLIVLGRFRKWSKEKRIERVDQERKKTTEQEEGLRPSRVRTEVLGQRAEEHVYYWIRSSAGSQTSRSIEDDTTDMATCGQPALVVSPTVPNVEQPKHWDV
ncbi:hypothetical protein CHU98_g5413 [Xylaria longipes]|nr:hypothetical protein CHU98_g5413 [Xylaria longipes]